MQELFSKLFITLILIGVIALKKYHVRVMKKDKSLDLNRIVKDCVIAIYVIIAAIIMINIAENISTFLAFYIALPIAISGLYVLYLGDTKIYAFYYISKGLFYFALAIFTAKQLPIFSGNSNLSEYAVGATISLAIIEGFTACTDGIKNLIKKIND